jgi:hypothetical protein
LLKDGLLTKWRIENDPVQVIGRLTKEKLLCPCGGIGEETAGYKGYGYATAWKF